MNFLQNTVQLDFSKLRKSQEAVSFTSGKRSKN